jgi:BASS family bile acid:Na+ symporter
MLEKIRHILADNQIMLVLLALLAGMIFPVAFLPFAPYTTAMLMLIFFTSSLRLEASELFAYAKDWKMLLIANISMLILMPIALWLPFAAFAPEWALAFLIVGAMPTGLTIALIADMFGGKQSLAMLISATTSVLAPITVPIVLSIVVGRSVDIPVLNLFGTLFLTIVVPFVLAMATKREFKPFVQKHDLFWREISLFFFALLVAAITANSIHGDAITLNWMDAGIILVLTVLMGGIAWISAAATSWRSAGERITIALCMVYMNNTLALYIGDKFFASQHIVPKLLIILTAVNLLLPPIKFAAARILKKSASSPIANPVL